MGSFPLSWPQGPHNGGATRSSFVAAGGAINTQRVFSGESDAAAIRSTLPNFAPAGGTSSGGIRIEDLRQIKEVAGRVGKDRVRELLDLLD